MNSKWGYEEQETLDLIEKINFTGTILNFAAGDGRFNNKLLEYSDKVIAIDKNKKDLNNLLNTCPLEYGDKLFIKVVDIFNGLPYKDESFDGIFCTGTLHSFGIDDIKYIVGELKRVLKKGGKFVFDFATDVERIKETGDLIIYPGEGMYSSEEAIKLIPILFQDDEIIINKYIVPPEKLFLDDKTPYIFKCNFLLDKYKIDKKLLNEKVISKINSDRKEKQQINKNCKNILEIKKLDAFIERVSNINLELYKDKITNVKENVLP